MSSNKILLRIICLLCAAALAAVGWTLLPERPGSRRARPRPRNKSGQKPFGAPSLYGISASGEQGALTLQLLLSAVLDQMEGRNPGVYFTLETLDPQQACQRMAQGETPDILSFPGRHTTAGPGDMANAFL